MEDAGQRLRRARERLDLRFRDVELASQQIADRHNNKEFIVMISRLSDIENHGTLPSIYRLYSLCCIYRLDLTEVLTWFGVPVSSLASDAGLVPIEKTHPVDFDPDAAEVLLPISLNPGIDLGRTFFVSEVVQRWGKLPLALVSGADIRRYRYGFVGTDDWSMSPSVPAGALLVIDDTKRRMRELRGFVNDVLATFPDPVLVVNTEGVIITVNKAGAQLGEPGGATALFPSA